MVRVVREGDVEIRLLPDVVAVVAGAAHGLTVAIDERATLDAGVPDGIRGDGLAECVDREGGGACFRGSRMREERISRGDGKPRECNDILGRFLEFNREACLRTVPDPPQSEVIGRRGDNRRLEEGS